MFGYILINDTYVKNFKLVFLNPVFHLKYMVESIKIIYMQSHHIAFSFSKVAPNSGFAPGAKLSSYDAKNWSCVLVHTSSENEGKYVTK